jgi:peptidoglycan/LPS O-acetylase OafA/YrhL
MIQRIQSIWLLLAAATAFASYSLPLFTGHLQDNSAKDFFIPDSFLLFSLIFGLAGLALVCIFLFKKRKLQFRLTIFGILFCVLAIVLEYVKTADFKQSNNFQSGFYHLGVLIPFAMAIFFVLAAKGINEDEKLVKSMDKLR